MVFAAIDDFYALNGQWCVESEVHLDGDSARVELTEAIGALYGRAVWLHGPTFRDRLVRVELERLEVELIDRARRSLARLRSVGGVH